MADGGAEAARKWGREALAEIHLAEKLKTLVDAHEVLDIGQLPQPVRQHWPGALTPQVVLTGERRAHYLVGHADMVPYEANLPDVIANPDEVHRNKRDAQIAILYRRVDEQHWLRATLWISDKPGLQNSIHSYRLAGTDEVQQGRKARRLLWQK